MSSDAHGRGARHRGRACALVLVAFLLAVVVAGCGGGGKKDSSTQAASSGATTSTSTTSTPSTTSTTASTSPAIPAFSTDDLFAPAGTNWISNGGGVTNDRYSTLDQIDTSNVTQLRGDWMTTLNGSGVASKYSAEGTAVEYNGTIYVPTGADDVFAVDAATGRIKWQYRANLPDNLASVVCCGWDNRGVAIGDGMVYSGQLDGQLVALDQNTGQEVWSARLASPRQGYTITMAPLYFDGKVFVGPSGAEYGTRGRMDAYDARSGRLDWRFYTIPKPGEPGSDTWPRNGEWRHGGATTWNTPSADPSLGMIYFSTANAGSDLDGSRRPGDNLYSSSIIALDANTGKMKWYFQQVHHDVWDFDSPSPTVLIDATIDGRLVHGIAQPSKNGYAFFLDRATGRPVFPIRETPVPQNAYQRTARTQPIPTMPPFSPVRVSPAALRRIRAAAAAQATGGARPPHIIAGGIYAGWAVKGNTTVATTPDAAGGDNWPPSSFDPQTQMYYVCSQSGVLAPTLPSRPIKYKAGQTYTGANFLADGFNTPGFLTAYDMTTGRIAWQRSFPDSCYSGAVSTAGGVVFLGRNRGELEAYDARTGDRLWNFQTGAGANAPVSIWASPDGQEHVTLLAGGNALAGTPHGDNLWTFSLQGTMGPARAGGSGAAVEHAGESRRAGGGRSQPAGATRGDATAGRSIFADNCSVCHGESGTGGNGGPDLTRIPQARTVAGVVRQVTNGGGGMPAFRGQLSDTQIADVAAYVTSAITGGR